ncbi:MAG: hypothetical protein K2X50_09495 [Gammaproteobacteria bacterium]|nr:hypothetical protein [Gammaproteobacteria bacterium]
MIKQFSQNILKSYKSTLTYIILIIVLNKLFVMAPLFVLFNELISPIDFSVGMVYIFRDFAQREIGRYVIIAMLFAGYLSYVLANETVAFASLSAFLIGEFIDWGIFTYTNKPLSQRLVLSATLSAPVDSFVFLSLLGRVNWLSMIIMTSTKVLGVLAVWAVWRIQDRKNMTAPTIIKAL